MIKYNIGNEKLAAEKRSPRLKKTILTSALSFTIILGSVNNVHCVKGSNKKSEAFGCTRDRISKISCKNYSKKIKKIMCITYVFFF